MIIRYLGPFVCGYRQVSAHNFRTAQTAEFPHFLANPKFHNPAQSLITVVPLRLCDRQSERIYAALIETVGSPAKQARGEM